MQIVSHSVKFSCIQLENQAIQCLCLCLFTSTKDYIFLLLPYMADFSGLVVLFVEMSLQVNTLATNSIGQTGGMEFVSYLFSSLTNIISIAER